MVSGNLVQRMDAVGQFVTEQAKAKAPVKSGRLRNNITYELDAREDYVECRVGVRKKIFWAYFMEFGARKVPAHPFLRPAVWQNKATILKLIRGTEQVAAPAAPESTAGSGQLAEGLAELQQYSLQDLTSPEGLALLGGAARQLLADVGAWLFRFR